MKKLFGIVMLLGVVAVTGCGNKKKAHIQEEQKETISRHFIEDEKDNKKEDYTKGV